MKRYYKGYVPKKKLGQNFLKDSNVIKKIILSINPKPKDVLLEVGAGLSALTKPISKLNTDMTVLELDTDLYKRLQIDFFASDVKVLNENVLKFNFLDFFVKKKKKIRIFGNLPYNISTELVFYLIHNYKIIKDMYFMFQQEVADRLIALHGNKKYGRLSVVTQSFFKVIPLFKVSPSSFFPCPKVNSIFLKFIPHKIPKICIKKIDSLKKIVGEAFKYRRKMLRNSLKNFFSESFLMSLNFSPTVRAEDISLEKYCFLTNVWLQNNS